MSKLKPCPFCGELPQIEESKRRWGNKKFYKICCKNINCKIQPSTNLYPIKKELIDFWNEI